MISPLKGIRVVDWTIWHQGPAASSMLGDLGADVIKIEERGIGDPGRGVMRISEVMTGVGGRNYYFESNNRNKRSIALDLKRPESIEIVHRLVRNADVFVQNFRKGVAGRLGLDYASLSKLNPRLIYASGSAWGRVGPIADEPSFDYTGLARSGFMTILGEPDMPPLQVQPGIADHMGGTMMAYGVLAALFARERFGIGQEIDVSLFGAMIWLMSSAISTRSICGTEMKRASRKSAGNPLWNHYMCKDGKWIAIALQQGDRHWPTVCRLLGLDDAIRDDPRFVTMETRRNNAAACVAILEEAFATRNREEWFELFKGEIICAPVNTVSDVIEDPQALENNYITHFNHPVWGDVKVEGSPVYFSEMQSGPRKEAPELGQHTEEVLLELGYTWDDIAQLRDKEVI